jgi:hypothetical protein
MRRATRIIQLCRAAAIRGALIVALLSPASLGDQLAAGQQTKSTPPQVPTPLATSVENSSGSWAAIAMGRLDQPLNTFWQLFFRPKGGSRWSDVVEGTAVATNGGLVLATPEGGPLLVGILPSNLLHFSPLLSTADGGRTFTPELLLMNGLAARPNALAESANGHDLALVESGTNTQVLQTAPGLNSWQAVASEAHLESSAAGRSCGLVSITGVAEVANQPVLGATCQQRGAVGILAMRNASWQLVGPKLPHSLDPERVEVLGLREAGGGLATLLAVSDGSETTILGAWANDGLTHWTISSAIRLGGGDRVVSFGPSAGLGWFVLAARPSGSRSLEVLASTGSWTLLPTPPAQAATASFGPANSVDVFGVSGTLMTDWRLVSSRWTKSQVINVPIQYGSS